jgi:hypothetical protein
MGVFLSKPENTFKSSFSKVKAGSSSAANAIGHEADPK